MASNRNVVASFGSFLNWATGSSNSVSLLGGSIQSIWVAYQILSIEQYNREIKTGLWREILRELSTNSKISLDTAIKVEIFFRITQYVPVFLFVICLLESVYDCENASIWRQWAIHISLVSTSFRRPYGSSYTFSLMAKLFCFVSC